MLFKDIIIKKNEELTSDFDKLFSDILQTQTHSGDLLLVQVNGFYNPDVYKWDNIPDRDPYMIGTGYDGHSDRFHYHFINLYRSSSISPLSYSEYLEKHSVSQQRMKEIKELEEKEALSITLEMLIYLKIWEADLFIKKLYQITNLSLGHPYDWHFKIAESSRDNNATGKRDYLIRKKIRDRLQYNYPSIYSAIKNAYKTQIRNSIAHSRYFCTGRYIHLTNYIKEDPACQIQALPFNDWIEIFHDTLALYNQLIGFYNRIDAYYSCKLIDPDNAIEVKISRKEPEEKAQFINLQYRKEFNDWHPKR